MDRLYTPWRSAYIESASDEKSDGGDNACVFCAMLERREDEQTYILTRARHNFVVLNRYPYISGHLMIVPYGHTAELSRIPKETSDELMDLTKHAQSALRDVYHPDGFNLGMNLGRAAGAGVADHLHLHVLPRWTGDTNFMSTVADTRVLPEDLQMTYDKLRGHF